MHPENTERLFQKFPYLFNKKLLVQGFECQDGWFKLIYRFAGKIREHQFQSSEPSNFEIIQVKQKMGGLRFYIRGGDDFTRKLIEETELESRTICELDGEPAIALFVCAPHWFRYLCDQCAELHGCMTFEDYLREKESEVPVHQRNQQSEECTFV